jgi:hypothetical protein
MTCADHPTAVSDCLGNGASCKRNLASHCEGGDLVTCFAGQELRVSCSQLDAMVCATWNPSRLPGARCLVAQRECSPGVERCVGSAIRFCDDGVVADVDCRALGFVRCIERDGRPVCAR